MCEMSTRMSQNFARSSLASIPNSLAAYVAGSAGMSGQPSLASGEPSAAASSAEVPSAASEGAADELEAPFPTRGQAQAARRLLNLQILKGTDGAMMAGACWSAVLERARSGLSIVA